MYETMVHWETAHSYGGGAPFRLIPKHGRGRDNILAMPLALANRFKVLVLALPIVAALSAVLYVTGRHGWAAFVAFIAALWLVLKIGAHYGLRISRQK
jgi:hypothetical protein